ncbi:SusC/RagA family TonB-linked outer membrane protein [Polaribacter sp. Asnod1-A03]|uniref:SusC/RagA family TonB-linked outer membrane protein n=1 Tax=Polaribacter sp. Asnod1-A03 TaxID=3160581 RepID=UPI003865CE0D
MTKLRQCQMNLKIFASLFWIVGFVFCGSFAELHAATPTYSIDNNQNRTITGQVLAADDNSPLPGVNIIVEGKSIGATTDFDGQYSINVPEGATLVFSYLGFVTKKVLVGNKNVINVSLVYDSTTLDEIVVVGFGTAKKETLSGSVAQVKGDEILRSKGTSNAALALQGEVAGVVVTRTSSRPGNDGSSIQIRGDISVNNISPLILLDGLEIPQWQLATINANDIESYSVLKDGAAAIFGTKAAGGVILVTTKKGKSGKMKVDYKSEVQFNIPGDMPVAGIQEWADIWLLAGANDTFEYQDVNGGTQQSTATYRFFTEDETRLISNGTFPMVPESYIWWDGKEHRFADANQYDAVYGTTVSERHNLSLSGGNENTTYRTSFGYANERSPIKFVYDGVKRYNFRTNLTHKVNDLIKTEFNVSYDNRVVNEPTQGVGDGVQDMYVFPLYNDQGQYYDIFGGNNLLAKLDEGGRTINTEQIFRLGGKITLDLDKFVKGLNFSYFGNMSSRNGHKMTRNTSITMYDWEGNVSYTPTTLASSGVKYEDSDRFFQNHVFQGNYNFSIDKHNFGILAGMTAEQDQRNNYSMSRTNMLSDELDDISTGDITTQTTDGSSYAVGLMSYIGKFNYDYDGIYLLELLGRRDGSSRLHPDYRWANFFSGSTGINLHKLKFIENLNFFDNLKIRASYGETGSVTGIGAYDYLSSIGTGSTIFGADPSLANTSWISGLTTTERSWERVQNTNFGLDFTFLDRRLSGSLDIFHRENNDMLVSVTYPQLLGAGAPKTNSGNFKSDGFEFGLNWKDNIGELKYNLGVMFWDSRSEVSKMEGSTAISYGVNGVVEGKPLNAIYTYKTDGLLQNESEVLEYYNQVGFDNTSNQAVMKSGTLLPAYTSANRLTPGSVRRVDADGDGKITTDDLVYYGDASAHNNYSFRLGLEYKGFDFSAFFQGVGQQYIVRDGALAYPMRSWWTNQNPTYLTSSWTPTNTGASNPAISYNGSRNNWNYRHINDINVIKASYLRAKILSLGYSLPSNLIDKIGVDRLRLSVTGNDLFVIDNIKDGFDPEKGSAASQGATVPYTSTMLFGLELSF